MSAGAGRSTQTAELVLTATNQTDRAFQQATANMDKLGRAFERSAANQSVMFQRAAGGVAGLERRLTAATAAMSFGEVLRSSVTEFAAIDRRMTRLGQNAEQSKQVIGNMKAELIRLAQETGQSVQSIFEGFETYVQQTGDYDKAVANIRSIAIANQALDADMKDTAQTARVLNDNLKFDPKDMMSAFEIFAQATRMGKFEAKDFAANMPVLAQAMNQAGMKGKEGLAEMAAVMELIARKSPDNERAVLGFRDLITKAFGTEVENHFKAAGSTLQGHLSNTLKNGGSVLSTIASQTRRTLESIALAETGDKSKYMSFIGRLFPEEDSRRAATAIIEYFSEVGPMMEKIKAGTGEVSKRFNEVKDDASSALERIGIKWFELKQQIGKSLVDVGVLSGMDKFSKDIDDAIRSVGALGDAITRIEQQRNKNGLLGGVAQTFKEIGGAAIGGMHAEMERVTRLNLERATRNGQKARIKARQAREDGRMNDAGGYDNEAASEEARAKRLAYQLKHGFDMERVFGNSDERVQGSFGGAVGDAMRMGEDPGAVARAKGLLPGQRGQINTGPALPPVIDPNSAEGLRRAVEDLRRDVESVGKARDEVRRVMRPEVPAIAQPPAINRAPDHVPGGLVDPYAPPPGWHPSSFEGQDITSMIQRSALIDRTGATTDTSGPTARGQNDQLRLTEETNGILRRLVTTAGYSGGQGGLGLGGAGGGGGGGFQMGGGGSGAGGVAGGSVAGATPRAPFGGGRGYSGGPMGPGGVRGGRTGPTTEQGKANVASWLAYAQRPVDQGGLGLTKEQAHGMVAGMQGESGPNLNAGAYNPNDRGRPSGGTMQWRAERLDALRAFAAARGDTANNGLGSVETQQQYQRHEFLGSGGRTGGSERRAYEAMKAESTREGSLKQFVSKGERPQFPGPEIQKRSAYLYGHGDGGGPPGATARNPFGDSAPGSAEGLRVKGGQATAGGASEAGVFDLARAAQGDLPGGVKHFSAFNDRYHQGTGSKHASGLAFDTSLNDPSQSGAAAEAMRAKLRAAGLSDADFRVIDEYRNPSARSTGGHIHTQFNTREAARRYAEYAKGARAQMQAQDKAEKAQVAAIPRSPFTPGSAGANPPVNTPLGAPGTSRGRAPEKNGFGGTARSLTDLLGPAQPEKKNAFGGATDLGGFVNEGEKASYGEFQGKKQTVPMPPKRPNIQTAKPSPLPPQRPSADALQAETAAIRAHREEAEKPIRLRYHSDGLQPRNTHAESIAMRRGNDASMRYARQNSYSDTGVA